MSAAFTSPPALEVSPGSDFQGVPLVGMNQLQDYLQELGAAGALGYRHCLKTANSRPVYHGYWLAKIS